MRGADPKQKFDPRSPVQPERSRVKYLIAASIGAGILLWFAYERGSTERANVTKRADADAPVREKSAVPEASLPKTGDVRTIFSADDYPIEAQRNGEEGTVQARLEIDEDGRVSTCTIVRSSGHSSLDRATCSILAKRARFRPSASGTDMPSEVTTPPIVWRLEG